MEEKIKFDIKSISNIGIAEIGVKCLKGSTNFCWVISTNLLHGGGGYLVERWVRGCASQIGCFFSLSGLPMAPFLFENWFRYRSLFCKMHIFNEFFL